MSVRWNSFVHRTFATPAYALRCASETDSPSAATHSTRPPALTTRPSASSAVPAWKTLAVAGTSSSPTITSPVRGVSGYGAAAITTPSDGRGSHCAPVVSSLPSIAASTRSTRSDCRRSITGCVSGSPKRTLNSMTLGAPLASIIRPAYRKPVNGTPSAIMPCTVGFTTSRMTRACTSGVTTGAGE